MLKNGLSILTTAIFYLGIYLPTGNAYSSALDKHEGECYAIAMVAYDTVINSNLGLPLDEIINSMVENSSATNTIDIYQDFLLLVVMDAYIWEGSPHTYAVKAFSKCAAQHNEITRAY